MRTFAAAALLLACFAAGCADDEDSGTESVQTELAASVQAADDQADDDTAETGDDMAVGPMKYAEGAVEYLEVYRPDGNGPSPVVVFVHGLGGSQYDGVEFGQALAAEGAVAYIPTVSDESPFVTTIEDVACVVRFARATAEDYGGDPDSVTLVGFSMGGSTGLIVALSEVPETDWCVEAAGSSMPDAFIGYEGAYDWAHNTDYPERLWVLEEEAPDVWEQIDPYAYLGQNVDLPVRLVHGIDEDRAWWEVEEFVSEEMYEAMVEEGHDVELVWIEGADHWIGSPGDPQFDEIVNQFHAVAPSSG